MIYLQPGLYVRIVELEGDNAPRPLPLSSGFSAEQAYRVLGIFSPSETSEAFLIMANDRDEIWFISNRHVRTHALIPDQSALRLALHPGGTRRAYSTQPASIGGS